MFPNITHILYDLGNTLVYFHGDWETGFRQAVQAAGQAGRPFGLDAGQQASLTDRLARQLQTNYERRAVDLVERPARGIFLAALGDAGIEPVEGRLVEAIIAGFFAVTQSHWTPVPGVEAAVAELRRRGFHQAVLSNAAHDPDVQALVDKAALRPHLDFVLSSAVVGRRKPDPMVFRRAVDHWGVVPSAVLMVGDNLAADIRGAQEAGMAAFWVRKYSADGLGEYEPDAVIETIADLPGLL